MIKTEKIAVKELEQRMRKMEIGTAIDLVRKQNDEEQWYGIRRLPDNMLDNGSCWIADVYGGGAARVFTDGAHGVSLKSQLFTWLFMVHLMGDDCETVQVAIKDGTEQEIRYDFQRTVVEPQQNAVACIDFGLVRTGRMYLSVPQDATPDTIKELGRKALCDMSQKQYKLNVLDTSAEAEPFILPDDIQWINLDRDYEGGDGKGWIIDLTTEPVGTVIA